ncbi:hypothetical protein JKP88DRAFT_282367 [Tribonema minus]|uniref:Erythromycin esterase n=1 Tax=Tribonema minus TaxID=303371 RepID=A0A836C9B6_9STRA|nr:hypothetical protein JKP88DRAFT_282367 [Tribonema minus]
MTIKQHDVQAVAIAAIGLDLLKQDDFKILREAIGSARVVCVGEESHGTEEFYRLRAEITKALIKHEGFTSVLCEADFPPFWDLNRFVGGTHKIRDLKPAKMKAPAESMDTGGPPQPSALDKRQFPVSKQHKAPKTIEEAMSGLKERFPVWMWHNEATRDFALWLKEYNDALTAPQEGLPPLPVALLGLDIYSLFTSADEEAGLDDLDAAAAKQARCPCPSATAPSVSAAPARTALAPHAQVIAYFDGVDPAAANLARHRICNCRVIAYLDGVDPAAAKLARHRYGLLGSFRPEVSEYAHAVRSGFIKSQAERVAAVVRDLERHEKEYSEAGGNSDEYFNATENARIVQEAEQYYIMSFMGGTVTWRQEAEQCCVVSFMGGTVTWNLRDKAMTDMIQHELEFQDKKRGKAGTVRVIIWAHNSHLGDAYATEHAEHRQHNVGALVRGIYGKEGTFLIGQSTHHGSVRAARRWSGRDTAMDLNPSLPDSSGDLLHQVALARKQNDFGLIFRSNNPGHPAAGTSADADRAAAMAEATAVLREERLQRFVGVSYVKATERLSHYSHCRMGDQYDAVIHMDETQALKPLMHPAPVPKEALRPGTTDYTKWQMLMRDLPEEELSDEEL